MVGFHCLKKLKFLLLSEKQGEVLYKQWLYLHKTFRFWNEQKSNLITITMTFINSARCNSYFVQRLKDFS